jgi:hypothetical protein
MNEQEIISYLLGQYDEYIADKTRLTTVRNIKENSYIHHQESIEIPIKYNEIKMNELIMKKRISVMVEEHIIDEDTALKLLKKVEEYKQIEQAISIEYINENIKSNYQSQKFELLQVTKQECLKIFKLYHLTDPLMSTEEIITYQVEKTFGSQEPQRNR